MTLLFISIWLLFGLTTSYILYISVKQNWYDVYKTVKHFDIDFIDWLLMFFITFFGFISFLILLILSIATNFKITLYFTEK